MADGERCTLVPGATAVFAGMRINYICSGRLDPGRARPPRPIWAVTYLAEGAGASELVDVAVVWH